jgi:26S proteasome regulatory subunit N3
MFPFVPTLRFPQAQIQVDDDVDLTESSSASAPSGAQDDKPKNKVVQVPAGKPPKVSPEGRHEVAAFFLYLGVTFLAHGGAWHDTFKHAAEALQWLNTANERTTDHIGARLYGLLYLAAERQGLAPQMSAFLLREYRTACLRRNDIGQAALLNQLLRLHINTKQFDAADKLISKTEFPEAISNNQFVRYLYYTGRIQAVQLDYSAAFAAVTQAQRKAPTATALGFRIQVTKLAIVVQLLLGEVPDKAVFHAPRQGVTGDAFTHALAPYLAVAQAVRTGDTEAFQSAVKEHTAVFDADANLSLIQRLTHTVLKAGLKKISTSYSRIAFPDIALKLGVGSVAEAETLCAKAIRDGVIDAVMDADEGSLRSREVQDEYKTTAPAEAFHRRIQFLLDVNREALRNMQYPAEAYQKDLEDVKKMQKEVEEEEADFVEHLEQGGDLDEEGDDL